MLTKNNRNENTNYAFMYDNMSNQDKVKLLSCLDNTTIDHILSIFKISNLPSEDKAIYDMLYNQLKMDDSIKNHLYAFISFCKERNINDLIIFCKLIKVGIMVRLNIDKVTLATIIINFNIPLCNNTNKLYCKNGILNLSSVNNHFSKYNAKRKKYSTNNVNIDSILDSKIKERDKSKRVKYKKENDIPRVEGEIIAPATANRIINQHNLNNPPAIIDAVAKEVDLNGQVRYADADNATKINYYKDTINSNILLQEDFYLPESHLKNLVEMLTSPKFKQTMAYYNMVPNKYGPDFTELRHYTEYDKTKYNLVLTARTTDKRTNIIVTVNTANTDYIGVFTESRNICNKSK